MSELIELNQYFRSPELENVVNIINAVEGVATSFFNSDDVHWQKKLNSFFHSNLTEVFYALYLIGGELTKKNEGERKDLDLLLATNALYTHKRWKTPKDEPIVKALSNVSKVNIYSRLPDSYNLGQTKGKTLLQLQFTQGKPIDLNYVRSFEQKGYFFGSLNEFLEKDCDKEGKSLPRLSLWYVQFNNFKKLSKPCSPF